MARVLIFAGQSTYGAFQTFSKQLDAAFRRLGHMSTIIDFSASTAMTELVETVNRDEYDFIFSFNGGGLDFTVENKSIYDILCIPFVAALVDHPNFLHDRLKMNIDHLLVTCVDRSHLDYLSDCYEPGHIKVKAFLPLGGQQAEVSAEDFEAFLHNRTIPVTFTGTFKGTANRVWKDFSPGLARLMDDITDYILANDGIPFEQAIRFVLQAKGIVLDGEIARTLQKNMHVVNAYVLAYRRCQCIEALGRAEIPLAIYGQGWTDFVGNYKSIKEFPGIGMEDTVGLLAKSKFCLNVNAHFVQGAHDRVFTAMLNGAIALTDESQYYSEEFIDGQDMITYTWTKLDELPARITNLLENPEEMWKIACAAREKAMARHTWIHRARQIVEIIEIYKDLARITAAQR